MRRRNKLSIFLLLYILVSILLITSGYCECIPSPSSLVSRWSASDNALDTMGLNNGTPVNAVTYTNGKVGQAFNLGGIGIYIDAGSSEVFNFNGGTGDFSIDAWIKPTVAKTMSIITKATQFPYSGWSFYIYADGKLGFGGAGVWEVTSPAGTIPVGTWSHVAITKSGGFYRLYKNGIEVASYSYGNLQTSVSHLRIGTSYNSADDLSFFNGAIDEVEVFNHALSGSEISAIFNSDNVGQCVP